MKIFIDNDCKCYAIAAEGRREFDTEFFDGKCGAFVEGYRYVPPGETWTRADGVTFAGEMISPWKDYSILEAAQAAYEQAQSESADMQAALEVLGVTNEEETT